LQGTQTNTNQSNNYQSRERYPQYNNRLQYNDRNSRRDEVRRYTNYNNRNYRYSGRNSERSNSSGRNREVPVIMPKQESTGRSSYPNTRSTGRLHNIEEKKQQEKQENSQVHNIDGFKFLGQSLKVQTGYLNQVSHGCLLPYIVLTPLKDGTPLNS